MDDILLLSNNNILREDNAIVEIIQNLRTEISEAILNAKVKRAFDKDVQLSIGIIHINPFGSVSEFSFNGIDVTDVDKFIVTKALNISTKNYFDIRSDIDNKRDQFNFYPISYKGKIFYTVLKTSKYFREFFGSCLSNHAEVTVSYALKYVIFTIRKNNASTNYAFLCGLFNPVAQSKKILTDAGRIVGPHSTIIYCFAPKTNYLLKAGETKSDFIGYEPRNGKELFDFYRGSIESAVFWISRIRDKNYKIKIKETKKQTYKTLIEIQYGSISNFCKIHDINENVLLLFFSGNDNKLIYKNGDVITTTRLSEILNIEINESDDGLKDKNLL